MSNKKSIYKIRFLSQGAVYEIYAKCVSQSALFGFIEIEELVFGTEGSVLVDPAEDKLRTEFEGVKRFYVPMHSVIGVYEVEKRGIAKIVDTDMPVSNVAPFPVYTKAKGD